MTDAAWRDVRALVTGARGFIGSHLVRRLGAQGAVVYGVTGAAGVEPSPAVTWRQCDLLDIDAVRRLVHDTRPDVVFHLAGHVTGSQDLACVRPTFDKNVASTVHLLSIAAERKLQRVVLAGSMQEPEPGSSDTPCSPYAVSKWACTAYARMFHGLYHVPVAIARPMMVYGPGQWDLTKLLPYIITSLLSGKSPALTSGRRELDWVFVEDVVEGLMTVARDENAVGRSIEFGSGELTSVRTIAERVAELLESNVPLRLGALADRVLEQPRVARTEETEQLIGWRPTTSLDEGLRRSIAWYREVRVPVQL